jgi:hypothetical protein
VPQTRRGVFYASAAFLSVTIVAFWVGARPFAPVATREIAAPQVMAVADVVGGLDAPSADRLIELARRDPLGFVTLAHEQYEKTIRAYRCTFTKQERLDDGLSAVQEVELRFRRDPLSIYLLWRKNAVACKRALFMEGGKFVDSDGQMLARVEPNGLARLVVADIMMPIDGREAQKASRHPITRAGFGSFFEMLDHYNELAAANGVLDFRYAGTGDVDGRPTLIFTRALPYTPDGPYPDAWLVTHFDKQTLLPIAVYSYADREERTLLGRYIYTDVELNPDFADDAFKF